jgi:hypothetical protein
MKVARLLVFGTLSIGLAMNAPLEASAQTVTGAAADASDITPTEESGSGAWKWLKMPSITMPKITFPKMPADPLAPIKSSARKVGDGTKRAWEGTKEIFTFGGSKKEQPSARVATAGESPSMFQRMFGGGEEKPAEGPATVGEWMAQPRVE